MSKRTIIILIVIVLVLVGVALAILFIPLPSISTYNTLSSAIEYEKRKGISVSLLDLQEKGYGENYEESFTSSHGAIINARKKIFGDNVSLKVTIDSFSFYSYFALDETLNDSLGFYVSNSIISKGASRSEQREIEKLINNLKENIDALNDSLNVVITRQSSNLDSENSINLLTSAYRILQSNYRKLLLSKSQLTLKLKQFVIKHSFNDNFMDTAYSALCDCYAYSINAAMSVAYESENGYLLDSSMVRDKIMDFEVGINIFTLEITERNFVLSFRDLYNNYNSGLENVFNLTHEIKSNVVNNNNFTNSFIRAEYQEKVRNVLVLIGIN